ncbi:hypothetical protein, partial [Shigella sp. SHS-8]
MADLAPTILDIAGVTKATAPDKTPLQGSSLADTLTNPSKTTVQPISPASFEMRGGRQVRMGNFK